MFVAQKPTREVDRVGVDLRAFAPEIRSLQETLLLVFGSLTE